MRAPFVGIVVAVALLCVENIGAVAYRTHVTSEHRQGASDAARRLELDRLERRIDELARQIDQLQVKIDRASQHPL